MVSLDKYAIYWFQYIISTFRFISNEDIYIPQEDILSLIQFRILNPGMRSLNYSFFFTSLFKRKLLEHSSLLFTTSHPSFPSLFSESITSSSVNPKCPENLYSYFLFII